MRHRHFALELMLTGIHFLKFARMRSEVFRDDQVPFRSLLCYGIIEIEPCMWLPVNRNYDVLGLIKDEHSDYKSDLYNHMKIKSEDINFDVLWDNGISLYKSKAFFAFSDSSNPTIYYKKDKESSASFCRYEKIILTAFFGEDHIKFEEAWGYKKQNPSSAKDYRLQLELRGKSEFAH